MTLGRDHLNSDEEEGPYFPSEEGKECPVCRQEYTGNCVLNVPNCPFEETEEDPFADEDEPDFEDVEDLDNLLKEDKEAEEVIEEDDADIPPEDLVDDLKSPEDTRG